MMVPGKARWLKFKGLAYKRRPPLVLVNGLAEQAETWFRNHWFWRRFFDVQMPNILAYEGTALQRRIAAGLPIDVDYLVGQLHFFLDSFVQTPPYHLVASSLGGKIAVEFAVRYPAQVERLVLLCPSGIGPEEQLPFVQGVRRSDLQALVQSVFHDPRRVDPRLLAYYARNFTRRPWRTGLVRTIRGTRTHCIRDRLPHVKHPTLFVIGNEDRIVDPALSEQAARLLPQGRLLSIPECGHAPHLERPGLVNRLVVRFLAGKVLEGSF